MRAFALLTSVAVLCLSIPLATPAMAQVETPMTVRVMAKDAKFIGTSMGGAHVVIRDKMTGDIIANGVTHGGTGDTKKIMASSRARDAVLVDDNSAKFDVSVDLAHPVPVTISATGPMMAQGNAVTTSMDMILIPGKDYSTGNGILLELPGFAIDIVAPVTGQTAAHDPDKIIDITANITKLCGCAVGTDTAWDPSRYDIEMALYKGSVPAGTIKMQPGKTAGEFVAKARMPEPGTYQIYVTAFDPMTKEGGMAASSIVLTPSDQEKTAQK